jgi:hypothetical protein
MRDPADLFCPDAESRREGCLACGSDSVGRMTNPIGVAEYQLQPKLPAEFKGRLPTAKQLSDVVGEAMPPEK